MNTEFQNWMIRKEGKSSSTAYQYALSIDKIIKHYYEKTNKQIDLYNSMDLLQIKGIAAEYSRGGKFSDFGDYGNGTIRNAIVTYVRYLESKKIGSPLSSQNEDYKEESKESISQDDQLVDNGMNFTYERDLENSLIKQAESLFPKFKIFGSNREGIEYCIEGKRIDLLLENIEENILLAIELKAGAADFRVFGQISMYLGLLSKKYPDKKISGLIIAGEIDESLKNACLITDKIELRTYQMQLSLEKA